MLSVAPDRAGGRRARPIPFRSTKGIEKVVRTKGAQHSLYGRTFDFTIGRRVGTDPLFSGHVLPGQHKVLTAHMVYRDPDELVTGCATNWERRTSIAAFCQMSVESRR